MNKTVKKKETYIRLYTGFGIRMEQLKYFEYHDFRISRKKIRKLVSLLDKSEVGESNLL